jgi:hypothetical protein
VLCVCVCLFCNVLFEKNSIGIINDALFMYKIIIEFFNSRVFRFLRKLFSCTYSVHTHVFYAQESLNILENRSLEVRRCVFFFSRTDGFKFLKTWFSHVNHANFGIKMSNLENFEIGLEYRFNL